VKHPEVKKTIEDIKDTSTVMIQNEVEKQVKHKIDSTIKSHETGK